MRALETSELECPRQIAKWSPPHTGCLHMNSEGQGFVGIGVVFRDHNSSMLSAFSRHVNGFFFY